jgi:hypothetical protein
LLGWSVSMTLAPNPILWTISSNVIPLSLARISTSN